MSFIVDDGVELRHGDEIRFNPKTYAFQIWRGQTQLNWRCVVFQKELVLTGIGRLGAIDFAKFVAQQAYLEVLGVYAITPGFLTFPLTNPSRRVLVVDE